MIRKLSQKAPPPYFLAFRGLSLNVVVAIRHIIQTVKAISFLLVVSLVKGYFLRDICSLDHNLEYFSLTFIPQNYFYFLNTIPIFFVSTRVCFEGRF